MNLLTAILSAFFGAIFTREPTKPAVVLSTSDEVRTRYLNEGYSVDEANEYADLWQRTRVDVYYPDGHPNDKNK